MTPDKQKIADADKIDQYWPLVGAHRRAVHAFEQGQKKIAELERKLAAAKAMLVRADGLIDHLTDQAGALTEAEGFESGAIKNFIIKISSPASDAVFRAERAVIEAADKITMNHELNEAKKILAKAQREAGL